MDDLFTFGLTRADEGDGPPMIHSIISTGDVARDDAIITPEGWDFRNYDANPAVLWNHGRDGRLPIGRTSEHRFDGRKLLASALMDEKDAFAMEIHGKVQRGFLSATSVRWHPLEWEFQNTKKAKQEAGVAVDERSGGPEEILVFLRQELLEWSLVQVGADPGAIVGRSDGSALSPEKLRELMSGSAPVRPDPRQQVAAFLDHLEAIANAADGTPAIDARRLDGSAIVLVRNAQSAIAHIVDALTPEEPTRGGPLQDDLPDEVVGQIASAVTDAVEANGRLQTLVATEVAARSGIPAERIQEAFSKED